MQNAPPDQMRLTARQAGRLAEMSGVSAKELEGQTIADAAKRLQWAIEPEFFLFRRVCGRVVKTDPVSGVNRPVPFATVHVEDTDCSFLGFFPVENPWWWLFPIFCHREELATVLTDACGRFCVWIPRFDIDWILRWRRERFCYGDIFRKPTVGEILERFQLPPAEMELPRPPRPGPDPPPFMLRDGGLAFHQVEALIGRQTALKLGAAEAMTVFGGQSEPLRELLVQPGFPNPLPPPLPGNLREQYHMEGPQAVAAHLEMDVKRLGDLRFENYLGPFLRCYDVYVPSFVPIFDVPDITFRVTQDVDGDGDQETIYAESFFDVRWNAGPIPPVTLHASAIAVAGLTCDGPEVPCETPEIVLAGLMPLHNLPGPPPDPYLDGTTGYAQRPNRPHPSGLLNVPPPRPPTTVALPLATTPFTGTLQLYGCNQYEGAQYYRMRYTFEGSGPVPFTNTWQLWRWVGSPGHLEIHNVAPDGSGWYPILPDAEGWMPAQLLLNWETGASGHYTVHMQLGNAAKAVIHETSPIAIRVDNTEPTAVFTGFAWREAGTMPWNPLPLTCPVVPRPTGHDIEFQVSYQAAATHLRSLHLTGGGCGGGTPVRTSAANTAEHWYTGPLDNNVTQTAVFFLDHNAPQGAYSFNLAVHSRAFNPAGGDAGFGADWNYDVVYNWTPATLPVAVVNV